ncbi:MAG: sigma-54 dependent transcriptional regulator, partial [Myxococcaceae bacterium]|nr:sigma-54 dependent transcriptional regulator [Myxococcaceae bacterium]
ARPVDAVVMDVKMPDLDGLAALERLATLRPGLPVIMMSGHGTIETAVRATQAGARDFLEKPIARDRLLVALRNALTHQAVVEELEELRAQVGGLNMVGSGPAMERIAALVRRTAPTEGRVLITGENGTGKELVARALHENSRRALRPFVKLNCAAVPHELIESELFGHERGAFTGAVTMRRGKFELASEGTLFLDEVGDMPQAMQAKLLRVLQEGELERVGGSETLRVDVRVIAATNKDLPAEIAAGRFREDLYYRLNVVNLHLPPLRERREDVPLLVDAFIGEACRRNGRRPLELSPGALAVLASYDYPGNVRELRNLVERVAILCEGPVVSAEEVADLLPRSHAPRPPGAAEVAGLPGRGGVGTLQRPVQAETGAGVAAEGVHVAFHARADKPLREQVEDAERDIILTTLAFTRDNVTEAARLLDLERGHFYKKMRALGLRRGGAEREGSGTEGNP